MAGQDGMDRKPELVDQAVLQQRVRQRAVTVEGEVRAVLLLEPGYLGCGVTADDVELFQPAWPRVDEKTYLWMPFIRLANSPAWPGPH